MTPKYFCIVSAIQIWAKEKVDNSIPQLLSMLAENGFHIAHLELHQIYQKVFRDLEILVISKQLKFKPN